MTNEEALAKARESKTMNNVFQHKTIEFNGLTVMTLRDSVSFHMNGVATTLNEIEVNNLRNLLSGWKNDKRYRDIRAASKARMDKRDNA